MVAGLLKGKAVTADPVPPGAPPPLWIFTSSANKAIAERSGSAEVIRQSGALLLENTCPEVVPYDPSWVKHVLTNSMKAEHYITSGLNGIPTSVMALADCIAVATGEKRAEVEETDSWMRLGTLQAPGTSTRASHGESLAELRTGAFSATGQGLPSQADFVVQGEAFVTDTAITFLGYVNRTTGVIEEAGHPADGQSMAGKIALFPKGSGSTVAPYVLLELFYRGVAPISIVNSDIDQQTAPACSLEGIPYAFSFDQDVIREVNSGDQVELRRRGENVTLRVRRRTAG